MSDPLGRHSCKFAGAVNEINGDTMCKLQKCIVRCSGVIEECQFEDLLVEHESNHYYYYRGNEYKTIQCPRCRRVYSGKDLKTEVPAIYSLGECLRCDHIRGDIQVQGGDDEE